MRKGTVIGTDGTDQPKTRPCVLDKIVNPKGSCYMLPVRQIALLAKFFDAFDKHLLRSMADEWAPLEPAITQTLWRMLNRREKWSIPGVEGDPIDWVQSKLARDGLEFSLSIRMRDHAPLEPNITYADFGLVIVFEDADRTCSQSAPYLVQAKKLYRTNKKASAYSANDKFGAANEEQRIGLTNMATIPRPQFP